MVESPTLKRLDSLDQLKKNVMAIIEGEAIAKLCGESLRKFNFASMAKTYDLQDTSQGWKFRSEAALEDFVWDNLEPLLGYQSLRRQHYIDGNYCDILAVTPTRQLVIIELKNTEDRYVVQQLTRYYHKLQKEKPFSEQVDYSQPVSLVALLPEVHEDNIIDTLYHQLSFRLISFQILGLDHDLPVFYSPELERSVVLSPSRISDLKEDIITVPAAPRTFRNALARCTDYDSDLYLNFRERILKLDPQLKEIKVENGYFVYGKGKTKPLACIAFAQGNTFKEGKRTSNKVHRPDIAFWLPISIHWSHKQDRLSPLFINQFFDPKADDLNLEGILKCQLFKKKRPTHFHVTETWSVHKYLRDFVEQQLMEKVSYDVGDLSNKVETYCHLKSLPNPLQNHEHCTEFFIEVALRYWRQRFQS